VIALLLLGTAAWLFLLGAFAAERLTARLRQDPPGYVDTSRGTTGRPRP